MQQPTVLILVMVLTVVLQLAAHWWPGRKRAHPLALYTYGTASILLAFSVWAGVFLGEWMLVLGAWICAGATGAGTLAGYVYDWLMNARIRSRNRAWLREVLCDEQERR
jgi:hypothetical protein